MSDITKIGKGIAVFILGYLAIVLVNSMLPTIISAGEEILPDTEISLIAWFMLITIIFIALLFIPSYQNYDALTGEDDNIPKLIKIPIAIILFLITIALTIKGWWFITALSDQTSTEPIINYVFWIGLLIMWIQYALLIPSFLIIEATK